MKEKLQEYVTRQTKLNEIEETIKEMKKKLNEEIDALKEKENYTELFDIQLALKASIENTAIQEYKETGSKKLEGGLGIQEKTGYDYNQENAFDWAKEHNLCLALDTKAFNSLIKTQKLDFVKEEKFVKVTWPTKGIVLND